MVDSSTPNFCASEELLDDNNEPVWKKLKPCQKNKFAELQGELSRHKDNSAELRGNKTVIDVFIFRYSEETVQKLVKYLGHIVTKTF